VNDEINNKDGNCYVFLPSYASMDQVTVTIHGNRRCSLGDVVLHDGMSCDSFELETPYDVVVNNHRETTLWFYQSANVATMYIDTDSGTMDYIHEDINYIQNEVRDIRNKYEVESIDNGKLTIMSIISSKVYISQRFLSLRLYKTNLFPITITT
jgi:hypothetical protein